MGLSNEEALRGGERRGQTTSALCAARARKGLCPSCGQGPPNGQLCDSCYGEFRNCFPAHSDCLVCLAIVAFLGEHPCLHPFETREEAAGVKGTFTIVQSCTACGWEQVESVVGGGRTWVDFD